MPPTPFLSIVVVVHDMARELPRTLETLLTQRDVAHDEYEIIVMDNGSPEPATVDAFASRGPRIRLHRLDPAPASPVLAANEGLARAEGELLGLLIDGARMASPGLLAGARRATRLASRPVVTAPAFHLGEVTHMEASATGYDQTVEDELLDQLGWQEDGYRLFGVSTLAGSSSRGFFGVKGESNSLFMPRVLWDELGGLDDRFTLPGGGLANHDLYRRACLLERVELIELLGEATFHQFHGGAATSRRFRFEEMQADYEAIRGTRYRPPDRTALHVGTVPPDALEHVEVSARRARERLDHRAERS